MNMALPLPSSEIMTGFGEGYAMSGLFPSPGPNCPNSAVSVASPSVVRIAEFHSQRLLNNLSPTTNSEDASLKRGRDVADKAGQPRKRQKR